MSHRIVAIDAHKKLTKYILSYKPGLFSKTPRFRYQVYALADDELSFVEKEDGLYELNVILTKIHLDYEIKGLFNSCNLNFRIHSDTKAFLGSKEGVTDYCLHQWRQDLEDESYGNCWQHVLETVTEQDRGRQYDDWMRWWLRTRGMADEEQWLQHLRQSDNTSLAIEAAKAIGAHELCKIIKDPNTPIDMRLSAIFNLDKNSGKQGLLTLVNILDDDTALETPCGHDRSTIMDDSYPFADHHFVKLLREAIEKSQKKERQLKTISDNAKIMLTILTEQDFGKDKRLWREWVEANLE